MLTAWGTHGTSTRSSDQISFKILKLRWVKSHWKPWAKTDKEQNKHGVTRFVVVGGIAPRGLGIAPVHFGQCTRLYQFCTEERRALHPMWRPLHPSILGIAPDYLWQISMRFRTFCVWFHPISRTSPKRPLNLCLKRFYFDWIRCVVVCFWSFFRRFWAFSNDF